MVLELVLVLVLVPERPKSRAWQVEARLIRYIQAIVLLYLSGGGRSVAVNPLSRIWSLHACTGACVLQ